MPENLKPLGKDIEIDFLTLTHKTKKYVENFSCGNRNIDNYFMNHSIDDVETVTYIFVDKENDTTIALASVSCSKIDFYDNGCYHSSMPAIEIKYFATNSEYHSLPYYDIKDKKRTLSKVIMSKLINHLFNISKNHIGASKVILNSVRRAIKFYKDCFFEEYTDSMIEPGEFFNEELTPMYFNLLPDF